MRFIGLDVHKRIVQACVLDANGVQLNMLRFNLTAETLAGFAQHHLDEDCALALEASTNTWAVVDVLSPFCQRIVVSNPIVRQARAP
jgi:transposase